MKLSLSSLLLVFLTDKLDQACATPSVLQEDIHLCSLRRSIATKLSI